MDIVRIETPRLNDPGVSPSWTEIIDSVTLVGTLLRKTRPEGSPKDVDIVCIRDLDLDYSEPGVEIDQCWNRQ